MAACIYWLDYEEGEEKDPEFLAASPRSPAAPALLAKRQPAPGVRGFAKAQSTVPRRH